MGTRPAAVVSLCAALAALPACGGDDRPAADPPPVKLVITSPADTAVSREDTVELKGRVSPARAAVTVLGKSTPVTKGAFATSVSLDEGANVIDVAATMPGRSAAFAAVRVTYDPRVTVPQLAGVVDDEAADRISALGLEPNREAVGGLLDELRSGDRKVCESVPPAGTLVDPGTEVTLSTAKRC